MTISIDFASQANGLVYPESTKLSKGEFVQARLEYQRGHRSLEVEFERALAIHYLPHALSGSEEFASMIFREAWEYGHSNGYQAVEDKYEDLATFATLAWDIGRMSK